MDRPEAGTVPGSHVLVKGLHGVSTAELAELLVHVVRAGAGVVAKPDTKVLDLEGLLFVDLRTRQDGAGQLPFRLPFERLQGLPTTLTPMISPLAFLTFFSCLHRSYDLHGRYASDYAPQEVPEARLGDDFIGRKNAHTVDLGSRVGLGGQMAPDDLVFLERHLAEDKRSVRRPSSELCASHPPLPAIPMQPARTSNIAKAQLQTNTHFIDGLPC